MNVTGLVNTLGTAVERYAYDPYGGPLFFDGNWTVRASSAYSNAILFAGYYRNAETGLLLARHRHLHANLGFWMGRDPIEYAGGCVNLYAYVISRPTTLVDAEGLWTFSIGVSFDIVYVIPRSLGLGIGPAFTGGIDFNVGFSWNCGLTVNITRTLGAGVGVGTTGISAGVDITVTSAESVNDLLGSGRRTGFLAGVNGPGVSAAYVEGLDFMGKPTYGGVNFSAWPLPSYTHGVSGFQDWTETDQIIP